MERWTPWNSSKNLCVTEERKKKKPNHQQTSTNTLVKIRNQLILNSNIPIQFLIIYSTGTKSQCQTCFCKLLDNIKHSRSLSIIWELILMEISKASKLKLCRFNQLYIIGRLINRFYLGFHRYWVPISYLIRLTLLQMKFSSKSTLNKLNNFQPTTQITQISFQDSSIQKLKTDFLKNNRHIANNYSKV